MHPIKVRKNGSEDQWMDARPSHYAYHYTRPVVIINICSLHQQACNCRQHFHFQFCHLTNLMKDNSGPLAELCENMTSSTKLEIHKVLHFRQRRTKPWPQITCAKNLVKFRPVVFKICKWADKQTR